MSKLGWALLIGWGIVSIALWALLPGVIRAAGLSFASKYPAVTQSFMTTTMALWSSSAIFALARPIIWFLAAISVIDGQEWSKYSRDAKMVHTFTLWALGILTAMTAYLASWLVA